MTGSPLTPDVPKGPATITGYTTAAVSFVAMLLAYLFPEGDAQTLGVIASGVVGLVALIATNLGRQKQAVVQIEKQAEIAAAREYNELELRSLRRARQEAGALAAAGYDYDEVVLPPDTEGLDPEYTGRTGQLKDRLAYEQREACS